MSESLDIQESAHHRPFEIPIGSVDQLRAQFSETAGWLFRGQSCADWLLKPSVVRYAKRQGITDDEAIRSFENRCYKEFTRRAHFWFPFLPASPSAAEWLSWMQHFGAPTRLLDVTVSPWVAAFFAMEDFEGDSAAIWAIKHALVPRQPDRDQNLLLGFRVDNAYFAKLEHSDPFNLTADADKVEEMLPHLIPVRLHLQKGSFLYPLDFKESICHKLGREAQKQHGVPTGLLRKLVIPRRLRAELLRELASMNIDPEALFPGPDGFGRALRLLT